MNERVQRWAVSASMSAWLLVAALGAQETTPPDAPSPTRAEAAYRDAWWLETGKGDFENALRGYLAAAAAEGPDAVRARALVAAGTVQQRLGKAESAIATFRQVLRDFAAQADAAEQARVHLGELTAVDLRDGFDEWYDRRLFSEESQLRLLGMVEDLCGLGGQGDANQRNQLRAQILRYGKAAAPLLRRQSQSLDDRMADIAIALLFDLGEMPSIAVLLAHQNWAYDSDCWSVVLRRRGGDRVPADGATLPGSLLAAALRGSEALTKAIAAVDVPVGADELGPITAVTRALLRHEPGSGDQVVGLLSDRAVPFVVRYAIEMAFAEGQELPLPLAVWLAVADRAQSFATRLSAIGAAAKRLRRGDEAGLDRLLDLVEGAPANGIGEAAGNLFCGLAGDVAAASMDWSPARLVRVLALGAHTDNDLGGMVTDLRRDDAGRAAIATAVLDEGAARLVAAYALDRGGDADGNGNDHGNVLANLFGVQLGDERDIAALAQRWNQAIVQLLDSRFSQWSDAQRQAALLVLQRVEGGVERTALLDCLGRLAATASAELRQRIEALRAAMQ